jgi:hypothetical protein
LLNNSLFQADEMKTFIFSLILIGAAALFPVWVDRVTAADATASLLAGPEASRSPGIYL